ncbi:MAG: hypothetical protein GTN86_11240 [Xanthomonadales bacterium]|nr:hypothetical protein [Xanthomonadales bacterium]NIN60308.1 hypothetical protein [Xanthomonadales bacterium]NIN75660.1 hypothetical protein [Xanthomonadales bacterium]NIO14733.1 hypothetical protein [Xanthomonadales bacterium]NIP12701.1 hypothetical protein [Xanthomonadales bacterium]
MAAQRRKKTTARRGARRRRSGAPSAVAWFMAGVIIGAGLFGLLFYRGYLPTRPASPAAVAEAPSTADTTLPDEPGGLAGDGGPQYDFFTVLPEMEVVVPEQELSERSSPGATASTGPGAGMYVLQAGSFRRAEDAEQMKARLALLGAVAQVQTVTVDDVTWHRVRIGPVQGARRADEMRRLLVDNGFNPPLVLEAGR